MNNYENIFIDYDITRRKKARKYKKTIYYSKYNNRCFYCLIFCCTFINGSSLNFDIRNRESSSILYSDIDNWEESEIHINEAENPTALLDNNIAADDDELPQPTPNPEENGVGVIQLETSLATPVPVTTRPPITDGLFKNREAQFTDDESDN